MKHYWNTVETPLKQLLKYHWNTIETPPKHHWNAILIPLKHHWNTIETHWKTIELQLKHYFKYHWDTIELYTIETPLKHHFQYRLKYHFSWAKLPTGPSLDHPDTRSASPRPALRPRRCRRCDWDPLGSESLAQNQCGGPSQKTNMLNIPSYAYILYKTMLINKISDIGYHTKNTHAYTFITIYIHRV